MTDINDVVKEIHSHGYVHGNLRPPNFIINAGRLLLVDFDWGGKEGEVKFPQVQLHPSLWLGRWDTNIIKDHDEKAVEYTKGHIRQAIKEVRVHQIYHTSN